MLDAAVVGAGVGGLVAGGLLARAGRSVLVLDAHDKPGGCASFYETAGFTFDAGATTLVGLEPSGPLDRVLSALGLSATRDLAARPLEGVDVRLPEVAFFYGRDEGAWDAEVRRHFPRAAPFFARVRRDAGLLWEATRRWPALPVAALRDVPRAARALRPSLSPLAPTFRRTVSDVEALEGAPASPPFRSLVDLALLITVQSPAPVAPWWNGALGIDLFRRGVFRPRGGMKTLATALASALASAGGTLRPRTLVTGVRRGGAGWHVRTAAGDGIEARALVLSVPVHDAARLFPEGSPEREAARREAARLGGGWGALVLNLGLARPVSTDPARLHRLALDRDEAGAPLSLFLSFSPPGDPVAPEGGQTLSASTHVPLPLFSGLDRTGYAALKERLRLRLRAALARQIPGLDATVVHEDLGTPRTFARYTRRGGGSVGGLRLSLGNSGLASLDPTLGVPGLVLVGDTTFPGQGTLAVALSGALAAERLGAVRLRGDGTLSFR